MPATVLPADMTKERLMAAVMIGADPHKGSHTAVAISLAEEPLGELAGTSARDVGEVHWLLFWPEAPAGNPCWPDATEAAEALMAACIRQLEDWGVTRQHAGGELLVRGVYGVPEQWPHIRALYQRAGFAHNGHTEIVYLARVDDLPRPAAVPIEGLAVRRTAGMNGTRLSAILGEDVIGYIEVETFEAGERLPRHGGWDDVGNLRVTEPYRRRGIASWLLGLRPGCLRCNSSKKDTTLERSRQPPTKADPRASELTSAEATPAPALLPANPQDVKDPDQLRILVEVEAQDAVARPEHDLTEPRVISWRPHHRIPGLSG
jgi:GNAT superfamily N-acetyltransferase